MKTKLLKILSVGIICLFSIIMVSCQGKKNENNKLAFISFNEENKKNTKTELVYNGLTSYENINFTYDNVNTSQDYIKKLQKLTKDKYNLIVSNGFLTNNETATVAEQNKDSNFAVIDSVIDPVLDNVTSILFNTHESSFLAGYLAGLKTETNKIGYIGFERGLISDRYEFGFKAGVLTAAKEKDVEISIFTKLIDSFDSYDDGKLIANEMYEKGADIIFQTVGVTGLGVIDSAKRHNKLVIGYELDQSYLAPDNMLTSVIKKYDTVGSMIIKKYNEGSLEFGKKLYFGLKEDAVGLTTFDKEKSLYSEDINKKVMEMSENIKSGKVKVPYNEKVYTDFK